MSREYKADVFLTAIQEAQLANKEGLDILLEKAAAHVDIVISFIGFTTRERTVFLMRVGSNRVGTRLIAKTLKIGKTTVIRTISNVNRKLRTFHRFLHSI